MQKNLLLSLIFTLAPTAQATENLSLDDVLRFAKGQTHGRTMVESRYESGMGQLGSYESQALPQLTFNLTDIRSQQANRSSIPTGGSSSTDNKKSWRTQKSYEFKLVSPLYSFGRLQSVWEISHLSEQILKLQKRKGFDDYFIEVIDAYTKAIAAKKMVDFDLESRNHLQSLYAFVKIEYERGGRSKVDYLRVKSNYHKTEARLIRSKLNFDGAKKNLMNTLSIPLLSQIKINASDQQASNFFNLPTPSGQSLSHEILNLEVKKSTETTSYYQASYLPSISLLSTVNSALSHPNPSNKDSGYGDLFRSDRVSTSFGLIFSWEIFSGFRTTSNIRSAIADKILAETNLKSLQEAETIQRQTIQAELEASNKILEAEREARNAEKLALEKAKSDYEAGLLSLTDLFEVENSYRGAGVAVVQAFNQKIVTYAKFRQIYGFPLGSDIK